MIRHLLVSATGLASDANLLAGAFDLARPFSAHVDVLHVRRNPRRDLSLYSEGISPEKIETIIKEAERNAAEATAVARRMFDQAVANASIPVDDKAGRGERVTAEWREVFGQDTRIVAAEARFADLVVLSRPDGTSIELDIPEGILFESGRPVLLAGGDMARLDSIAIAWDGGRPAVRAVAGALDFITRATKVTILVVEGRPMNAVAALVADRPDPRPERLVDHLAWHGVHASVRMIPRDGRTVGEALAETSEELNVGLLVMGAYGHSRFRETILGGATRHMLANPIGRPVLLAH
jgi:nucleotide-binding universal stress UspA family protein